MKFEITTRDNSCGARCGKITTARGIINTPVFMPVGTRGTIRALTFRDIEEIGFEIILANTYHLYIRPGIEVLKESKGLHNFMNYRKPVLTDSGGFQVFSLPNLCKVRDNGVEFRSHIDGSKHFFSPEKILDIQNIIGSDIMMVLDQCISYPAEESEASVALDRTIDWAKLSYDYWNRESDKEKQALFAIIQGGVFKELREKCANELAEHDFSGYAIGGLSVGEPKELYKEITEITLKKLPENKPRYMMGVGSPAEILFAVMHGVDMFDCVMPTRIARNGTLFTSKGRINIKASKYTRDFSPLDPACSCYVCRNFSKAYLRHIFRMGEISALIYNSYHNLFFMKTLMDEVQAGIRNNAFHDIYKKWEGIYTQIK